MFSCVLLFMFFFFLFFFFFNDTATTEIYTLSPTRRSSDLTPTRDSSSRPFHTGCKQGSKRAVVPPRSEEHTSELQSQSNLVCRLLLEKKKKTKITYFLKKKKKTKKK